MNRMFLIASLEQHAKWAGGVAESLMLEAAKQLKELNAVPLPKLGRHLIRSIFMQHGFTIKEGQSDLKSYVYDAAEALLAQFAAQPQQPAPAAQTNSFDQRLDNIVLTARAAGWNIDRPEDLGAAMQEKIDYLSDYKLWYEEALGASNAAGYAGYTAADTIRDLDRRLVGAAKS